MEYPLETIVQWLRRNPVFGGWPEDHLRELAGASRVRRYRRRTLLAWRDGQRRDVLLVVSGSIELTATNPKGNRYLLSIVGPGQITRLVYLLEDVPRLYDYYAREDSEVVHLPGAVMARMLDADLVLWRSIARIMLRRFHASAEFRHDHVLGTLRRRTAAMLLQLACRFGDLAREACDTELSITQTELADLLGVSRQSVGRELALLKDEDVLDDKAGYRRIRLLDVPALARIAREA